MKERSQNASARPKQRDANNKAYEQDFSMLTLMLQIKQLLNSFTMQMRYLSLQTAASTSNVSVFRRMVTAIQSAPSGYIPPNAKQLGSELLDSCYESMWSQINARDPDGAVAMKFGSAYVSDGWDSCDKHKTPLINSAFITANDDGVFWRSVDTTGRVKTAEYCAAQMKLQISMQYAYGPLKVVVIISDTCSTMRKCWDIVQDEFPWISVLPCQPQPHVISLLMKDLAKTKVVS